MGAANLLSTQARIVKPTSPDFHRELREGEYDAYINHLDFFKKAKVLKIPTKHKSMKAAKGEYDVMLMESSRVGKE